jgi:peptide deformylase
MAKGLSDLILLGDPRLYEVCTPVEEHEHAQVAGWAADLHDVMEAVRAKYHFGRAIAAPQLGIMKRLIYMNIERPVVIVNPELSDLSEAQIELWDDCMCFPNLLVRVKRHRYLTLRYLDADRLPQVMHLADDRAELIQHEYDHLNGILCTMRAIDAQAFKWRNC